MRPFARASALAVAAALALPGCVVAIDTPPEDNEQEEALSDADEAYRDSRLLQLEERMDQLEQRLTK